MLEESVRKELVTNYTTKWAAVDFDLAFQQLSQTEGDIKSLGCSVGLRVSMSLGHPQVPVGLSVGNPQVKWPTDLSFWVAQVFADLGSTSVEAGTHHRYPPYLSLNLVQKN